MDMQVARDGPDAGRPRATTRARSGRCSESDAHYYEPAGAVSWDVAMTATRPDWRVHLKAGDVVSVNATYDVRKASWYESMGIFPLEVSTVNDDPLAKDPFDDAAAVKAMYDEGGILTHGRLPENIDTQGEQGPQASGPAQAAQQGPPGAQRRDQDPGFLYSLGGYSAIRGFPTYEMRPPVVKPGQHASPSPTTTRCSASPTPSRSGTASPPARRPATRARGSATRSPTGRSSSTPASSASAPGFSSEVTTRLQRLHDAAADQARQDLHLLLPHPPVHARLDPRRGRQAQAPLVHGRARAGERPRGPGLVPPGRVVGADVGGVTARSSVRSRPCRSRGPWRPWRRSRPSCSRSCRSTTWPSCPRARPCRCRSSGRSSGPGSNRAA